jgi:transposase-like protein
MSKSVLTAPHFHDEAAAIAYVEGRLWPMGPTCPHCGNADAAKIGVLKGKSTRLGVKKCYACRKPFTVKVGTIFESSHVPMHLWLQAIHLICASKKGISSNQLHRILGITLKSAWFLSHRIRLALMSKNTAPIGGEGKHVEIDETFIGFKDGAMSVQGGTSAKRVVFSLVERGGEVRSFHIKNATIAHINPIVNKHLNKASTLNTDEASRYVSIGRGLRCPSGREPLQEEICGWHGPHEHPGRLLQRLQARHARHLPALRRASPAPLSGQVRFPL